MDDGQTLRSMVRDDAYRVERVLADGPSGRTELVTLNGEGPLVRKRIPTELANAAAWAVAMEANEPLLPRIESLYSMPDELVVVYDYVPGETLEAVVEKQGAMNAAIATGVMLDLCRAVSALHERGVVHRDITPANVVMSSDGAHLVDLGIARRQRSDRQHDTTTLGTWGFAAPEQYGFAQTDARSDVYALGRLLGYLLTGLKPGGDEFDRALRDAHATDAQLSGIALHATAFEPSARYQSASELAAALRETGCEVPQTSTAASQESPEQPASWSEWQVGAPSEHEDPRGAAPVPPSSGAAADAYIRDQQPISEQTHDATFPRQDTAPQRQDRAVAQQEHASPQQDTAASQRHPLRRDVRVAIARLVWVVLGMASLFLVFTAIGYALHPVPTWDWSQDVMVAIIVGAFVAVGLEVYRLAYERAPYVQSAHPVLLFLRRLLTVFAVALVLFFALVVVYATLAPTE